MDNKDKKRGFSGLSELTSDVSVADHISEPEPSSPPPQPHQLSLWPNGDNEKNRKASGPTQPIENVGSGKSTGESGWKWILGIVVIIFIIWWLANNGGQSTKSVSYNPSSPTPRSYYNPSTRSTLAQEIEYGKTRAKQMETQIKDMDDRLEEYERRMRSYRVSGMTVEYNMLVPSFNSLVRERKTLYGEYSRLVDEVNSKVSRYNLGSR
jgi:hypothetical protein